VLDVVSQLHVIVIKSKNGSHRSYASRFGFNSEALSTIPTLYIAAINIIVIMADYRTITPAHRAAILETVTVASSLVPPALRSKFVLIGSAALLYHGSDRRPNDVDFVGTTEAHWQFLEAARADGRFSVLNDGRTLPIRILIIHTRI
jgi:hypothetical protein